MDKIELTQNERDTLAVIWWARGYNVVLTPIGNHTQISWGKWERNRQTKGQLRFMLDAYKNYPNVAVLTGYNGHIVFDCDRPGQYEALVNNYPALLNTYTVKSGREDGYHIHIVVKSLPDQLPVLDCELWSYGKFAQLPGSIHETGIPYTLLIDKPLLTVDRLQDVGITVDTTNPPRKEKSTTTESPFFSLRGDTNGRDICPKIKAQVSILDILPGLDFVESGPSHYMAFCPFHPDTERSLSYHKDSKKAKCFNPACVAGNVWHSVIDLYMFAHNCDKDTAISELSRKVRD